MLIKKIFVINLDRRSDRFENFTKKLISPLNSSLIERVSAIDGRNLIKLNLNLKQKKLNEIGCFLSHKKCLLKIICNQSINDDELFIVLEDDICFSQKYFSNYFNFLIETLNQKKIENISYFNKEYNLKYFIGYFGGRFNENFTPDHLTRNWIKLNDDTKEVNLFLRRFQNLTNHYCFDRTTHFIMMNKQTAKIIYDFMKTYNIEDLPPIDVFYQDIQKKLPQIEIVECFPHICYSPISKDSDIQYEK
jgi:GR25 family glycosyltransferase involved in LPS biosynthesis